MLSIPLGEDKNMKAHKPDTKETAKKPSIFLPAGIFSRG